MKRLMAVFVGLSIGLLVFPIQAQTPREILITTLPGLQFDRVQWAAKPGEKLKIIFTNQDDMSHNLLLVKPGRRLAVVQQAEELAEKGPEANYIPNSPDILWSIPVISPGQSASIELTAPSEEGAYPYVCTYPGHGYIMYGVMHVSKKLQTPPLDDDPDVPDLRKEAMNDHAHHHEPKDHPFELVPPYYYRAFMEGSGLASVAVRLPQRLAYCWDASACKLQYAWSGDFLDNKDFWHGHKNAYAQVLGEIFYRDQVQHPLRIGNPMLLPTVIFKGYRLVDRYPEFNYLVNGVEVFECIREKADGTGLERRFRIPYQLEPIWFHFSPNDGMSYECSSGQLESKGIIKLSPEEAAEFTIIMTRATL